MKNFIFLIMLSVFLLSFTSCEKIVSFDLDKAKEVIVIEATMTNDKEPPTVLVSKTSAYFGANADHAVSGARVSVRADGGKNWYFEETEPGVYKLGKTIAGAGHWYTVDVRYEGITYSARSYLNELVPIVDFGITYFDGYGIIESGYKVSCFIKDPAGIENYYRMKYEIKGKPDRSQQEICVYTDKLFDGIHIGLGMRTMVFGITDSIRYELQSIDQSAYTYFSALESISGIEIIQSASPANPVSNFNNGALGYFSAYSSDTKTVIISSYIK